MTDAPVVAEEALDCPMCNAPKSFTIDHNDGAVGYCSKENKTWTIRPGLNGICNFCHQCVPVRRCDLCGISYCNEGDDDDRFCAITHDNQHEDSLKGM